MPDSRRFLVLCHGNVNRSALAGHILKVNGFNVESAGFRPERSPAAKKTRDFAKKYGYDLSSHRSQPVTEEMMKRADVILYMDAGNFRRIGYMGKAFQRKSKCLGDYVGATRLPDPGFMKKDSEEFREAMELVVEASLAFVEEHK